MRPQILIAFLLGVIATLLAVLVFGPTPAPVLAQSAGAGGGFVGVTANTQPGSRDILWLVNATEPGSPHLCIYELRDARLYMLASRNITYDSLYDQYPGRVDSQEPSVDRVYKDTKKKRDDARKPAGQ